MASVQLINANMTLFLHVFDKLLDSDVKNGILFILRTGQRTEVLLSCLKCFYSLISISTHNLGRGVEWREKSSKYFGNTVWSKCYFALKKGEK